MKKEEIIEKEIEMFKKIKSNIIKGNFKFTYPEETKEKYAQYFI